MGDVIKVFGHKSPDTDCVCSSIACAWLINQKGEKAQSFVLGDLNKETMFVLKHFEVGVPSQLGEISEGDEVVIVDTNNPDELPEGLEKANILSIIDHHKLSGLKTDVPVTVMIKPTASSAALIYETIAGEKSIEIDKKIAAILLASIISDTLKFTSPTTTDMDKMTAMALAKIAEEDIDQLAEKMFEAKSDLTGMRPEEILLSDSKVYEMGNKKVRISVHETTKPENAKSMKNEILQAMNRIKDKEKTDALYFFIVDILNSSSEMTAASQEELAVAQKAFGKTPEGEYIRLEGVVSRKKQMVPALQRVYEAS